MQITIDNIVWDQICSEYNTGVLSFLYRSTKLYDWQACKMKWILQNILPALYHICICPRIIDPFVSNMRNRRVYIIYCKLITYLDSFWLFHSKDCCFRKTLLQNGIAFSISVRYVRFAVEYQHQPVSGGNNFFRPFRPFSFPSSHALSAYRDTNDSCKVARHRLIAVYVSWN